MHDIRAEPCKESLLFSRTVMGHATSWQALAIVTIILLHRVRNRISNFPDDLIIGSLDFNQQLQDIRLLFEHLRRHDFRINPKKVHLFYKELDIVGFRATRQEICISPKIAKKIK